MDRDPYRFPALAEERAEAARQEQAAMAGSLEELLSRGREHGFAARHKRREDGSVDACYANGQVVRFSPAEVALLEAHRAQMDADDELVHGPPARTLQEAVRVTHYAVPWDMPSESQEELLASAASLLDRLNEPGALSSDERDALCTLLNAYGAERWGMLPLFEIYRAEDGYQLGYRLNAFEAVVLPKGPIDYDADSDEERELAWESDEGLSELDRLLEVLADTSDEMVDDTQLLCERAPTMSFYLVRNGRLYEQADWPSLYGALEGRGYLWRPLPERLTPVLVVGYRSGAYSVSALMERAKQTMYQDELWAARLADAEVGEETLAAMERLSAGGRGSSPQLERIRRLREGRDRVKETWAALLELSQRGRALLPDWERPEQEDEEILVKLHWAALDEQLRSYYELNPELELEALEERPREGLFDQTPRVPADPRPGFQVFSHYARAAWDEPGCWWTRADRGLLESVRGKWVVLDRFFEVLGAGADPEELKRTPHWQHIVSVPEEGFEAGLVITNPDGEA